MPMSMCPELLGERQVVEAYVEHLLVGEDNNDLVARVEDALHLGRR